MAPRRIHPLIIKSLKGIVSAALLAIVVWLLEWNEIVAAMSELSSSLILVTILILLLEFPVLGYRWYLLIRPHSRIRLYQQLKRYFIANFFNTFTPAQIGGDTYRFIGLKQDKVTISTAVGRLLHERLVGLIGFLIFFLGCFLYAVTAGLVSVDPYTAPLSISAAIIAVVLLVALFGGQWVRLFGSFRVVQNQRWLRGLHATGQEMFRFGTAREFVPVILLTIAGGCVIWTVAVTVVARDIGVTAPFVLLGMAAILTDLIRLVPISIQGIGLREATFAYSFQILGLNPEQGFAVGVISYLAVWVATLLIGGIGYIMPKAETKRDENRLEVDGMLDD